MNMSPIIFILISLSVSFQGQSSAGFLGNVQSPLEKCLDLCQSHSCQNDRNVREGCAQMFSCAHGCKLRQLGVEKGVCRDRCERNGQSGCSPNVSGWKFDLCRECNRGGCTKWPQVGECEQGCDFYNEGGGGSGSLGQRWCRIGEHELDEQNPSPILRCGGGSSGAFNTGFSESITVSAKGTAVNFLSGTWNYHSHYGGRPVYKKENGGYYLFWQENRWVVEPKIGRHTHESGGYPLFGYIRAEVDELYPENVGNRWMEVYSRQVDPNIYVTGK